ncbi:MAG: SpoIID/LytB domain-containing protein [Dysgonamonadaceae bacterium]|jgi:SpoIID/LytB domain protein|nr:SpoIID/LytB domain-containing protein [Dysgonamonadaceae bacterium]
MKQPFISIGIMAAGELRMKADPAHQSFIVQDVPIGIDFHWERKEDQEFQGEFQIKMVEGKMQLINILPLEDYLISVISSEMSATNAVELLKAHAVVSRTWLLAQKEKAARVNKNYASIQETENEYIRWYDREDHAHFDVCADDHCQRYQGITRVSTPEVKEAVTQTIGEVLTYQGQICDTRFSKCCGGRTETFENVWEPVAHPYLQSVSDDFCQTNNAEALKQVLNGYDQETHDFYRWQVIYTQEEIQDLIRRKSGWDFGEILDLVPLERGKSGRIIRLQIIGSKRSKIVGKELFIRKILSESHLYSSAFTVEKMVDSGTSVPSRFILNGSGWGHGVGLCQIGAAMMALEGYDYRSILKHYFPETELTKIY